MSNYLLIIFFGILSDFDRPLCINVLGASSIIMHLEGHTQSKQNHIISRKNIVFLLIKLHIVNILCILNITDKYYTSDDLAFICRHMTFICRREHEWMNFS